MNVAQMHIAVNQGVQKIASSQVDVLLPEEIDFELNKAQDRFIKARYNQFGNKYSRGFEGSQKRIDDLRTLVKETSVSTQYKGQIDDKIFVDFAILPDDYMFLINQRSLVYHNNCSEICTTKPQGLRTWIEFNVEETAMAPNQTGPAQNSWLGPNGLGMTLAGLEADLVDEAGNSSTYTLLGGPVAGSCTDPSVYLDQSIWDTNVTVSTTTPFGDPLSVYNAHGGMSIALILPLGWTLDAGGTIRASYTDCETGFMFNGSPNTWIIDLSAPHGYGFEYSEVTRYACEEDQTQYTTSSVNRYSQLDDIYTLLKDPFNTTKHTSPLTTIVGHNIDIYTDETFYIPKVKLTYIKKPRSINSSPGFVIACELADHTHQEDMAVASILEEIADPRYQTNRMEELRSE